MCRRPLPRGRAGGGGDGGGLCSSCVSRARRRRPPFPLFPPVLAGPGDAVGPGRGVPQPACVRAAPGPAMLLFSPFLPPSPSPPPASAGRSQAQAPAQCGGNRWLSNPGVGAGKRPLCCSEIQGGQLAWQDSASPRCLVGFGRPLLWSLR